MLLFFRFVFVLVALKRAVLLLVLKRTVDLLALKRAVGAELCEIN